ncbi:MAG: hypothetical protein ABL903_04225 [Methylococcales bacterium]
MNNITRSVLINKTSPDYLAGLETGKIESVDRIKDLTSQLYAVNEKLLHVQAAQQKDAGGLTEAINKAVMDERRRCSSILKSAESQGRRLAAEKFAFETSISTGESLTILRSLPVDPREGKSEFEKHMTALGNPQISPCTYEEDDDLSNSALGARIGDLYNRTRVIAVNIEVEQ